MHSVLGMALVVSASSAIAQAPVADMTLGPEGRIAVSLDGRPMLSVGLCAWHGEWVYLAEYNADITRVLVEGATQLAIQMPPGEEPIVEVQVTARSVDGGLDVEYRIRKLRDVELKRGMLTHFAFPHATTQGHRAFISPGKNTRLPAALSGTGTKMGVELTDGLFFTAEPARPREFEFRTGDEQDEARMTLTPADFPVDVVQTETVQYRFERIEGPLPGEIVPMNGPLAIRGVTLSAESVPLYGKLELTVDLSATYVNPFDPDQIALDAVFTTPSGRQESVPGFLTIDHKRSVVRNDDGSGIELMEPTSGRWCVRFAPRETGGHRCRLTLRDRSGEVRSEGITFDAVASDAHGFVRAARQDPHYLQFDDGAPYIPIGHNLPGYHSQGQLAEDALRKMAAAGENYNRWWMYSYELGIEWEKELGRYRQASAARMDYALDLADELGMYYMLCMDTHQDFLGEESWSMWHQNPYNVEMGGPCKTPAEWFTNEAARKAYRNRLRYIVARWGYSPHVLAWEFGNEFEGWPGMQIPELRTWTAEMGDELRKLDPFRHLITTSFWGGTGYPEIWDLPQIDVVQTHFYLNSNEGMAEQVAQYCRDQHARYAKPHIFGEFGIRSHESTADKDPEGWGLHNTYWSGLMTFCNGTPMPWWHENYIDPLNLYFHFTSIARFVEGLDPPNEGFRPFTGVRLAYADGRPMPRAPLVIRPDNRFERPSESVFPVAPDGSIANLGALNGLLQGQGHPDLRNPPTFEFELPEAGEFIAHIGRVSAGGHLMFYLDGQLLSETDLPTGDGIGTESRYVEQWKLWESVYDTDVAIPVPAGKHEVRIDNTGTDWVTVTELRLTNFLPPGSREVLVFGMAGRSTSIAWVQNPTSTWYKHLHGEVKPVDPVNVTLCGLPDGPCTVELWETWKGAVTEERNATVANGELTVELPQLDTDIALKMRHER